MTPALASPTRARIAPLIRLLSTGVAGERDGAVLAIGRVLESARSDWHDLACAIEVPPASNLPPTFLEMARWVAREERGFLDPRERDFVRNIAARLESHHVPTPKQGAWLGTIFGRLAAEVNFEECAH